MKTPTLTKNEEGVFMWTFLGRKEDLWGNGDVTYELSAFT